MADSDYDFLQHYHLYTDQKILFAYNGKISQPILQQIISIIEDKLADYKSDSTFSRKIISIIIELAQNIRKYSAIKTSTHENETGHGMLVVKEAEKGISINAGNLINPEDAEKLITYCSHFIDLKAATLKELYHKKLKAKRSGNSDSAGLGLLHILMKADSSMKISKYETGNSRVLLVFSINVENTGMEINKEETPQAN